MSSSEYIAIDLGATSGRVILACIDGGKISAQTLHRFPTPLKQDCGKYFWDIEELFSEIVIGISKAKGHKIESIGIDSWGVDFCQVGPDGKVSMPRAYRDPYTQDVPESFFKQMPSHELYSRTGVQIMNFNSVFQMYAQKNEGSLKADSKILFIPDALSYLLTGEMVCEYTILSTSALMNPRTKDFDEEILRTCGLNRLSFPHIVYPGHTIGVLKDCIAQQTGLGKVKVVAVAGHDTASAIAAIPASGNNYAYLSSGTWSLMGIETAEPVINDRMFQLNFTNEGGAHGNTRLLKNITGMWLLEQCLVQWRKEGREYSYSQVQQMAENTRAAERFIDPDAPDFSSPTDMPKAIAGWCTANGFPAPENDAQTVRLIYDSLAQKYARVFACLEEIAGHRIETMHIIGGGAQNHLLNQLTANSCGVKVIAGPSECTALGNIMIQAGLSRKNIIDSIDTKTFLPQ